MQWFTVDLPNLTSISSSGDSFSYSCNVALDSILQYRTLILCRYSKSTNYWFAWVFSKYRFKINFEYCLLDRLILIHRCVFYSRWFSQYWRIVVDGVNDSMNSCLFLIQIDTQYLFLVVYTIINILRYLDVAFVRQKEVNDTLLINEYFTRRYVESHCCFSF